MSATLQTFELRRLCLLLLLPLLLAPVATPSQAPRAPAGASVREPARVKRPRLVVIAVVDQMRADYFASFGQQWTRGLRRLYEQGAVFERAAFPYWNTVTCPGHSTIGTGALPATHGIILNEWWDAAAGRNTSCTDDPQAKNIGGTSGQRGHSPWRLMVPTLADEMRAQLATPPRVVVLSRKARSAIGLAGHGGDAVIWLEGDWQTSSFYGAELPAFVRKWAAAHPQAARLNQPWTRLLPESSYLFDDHGPGERPPASEFSAVFPHARNLPANDAALGELARAAVETYGMGRGPGTDFLGVSFSELDSAGHDYGPRSHEVQDVLARLDAVLGDLLAFLDRSVGAANYVLALTADHGVSPIPKQVAAKGIEAGRFTSREVAQKVEAALQPFLGAGPHVARVNYTDLYFRPGVMAALESKPEALRAVEDAILSVRGVWRVFQGRRLAMLGHSGDWAARAAARSYFPGRSGDLIILARPYFFSSESATTHGSGWDFDARVPLILFGAGIRAGTYDAPAGPQDIAPTLARLAGVTLAHAAGRVLSEALLPAPPQRSRPAKSAGKAP